MTLLGSLMGLLASLLPHIVKYVQDRQDKKHEVELLKLQMQAQSQGHQERLKEIEIKGDIEESAAMSRPQASSGVVWMDAYNSSVRPTIAYGFFLLYAIVKYAQYRILIDKTPLDWDQALVRIWTPEDMALFASIISFYFGTRAVKYALERFR